MGCTDFNRQYLKRLFLERTTAAYFTFGTLANAALVTTAFLHVAISGTPDWHQLAPGYLTAGNYGPIVVLLAAMVFHTDYHLKQSLGNLRRFSSFTFVGYAVSFIGLGLSLVPYVGQALGESNLVAIDSPLLQNFAAAQALLMAIVLYAWLVWRYESIPPLFLLLLAIIGEYHILVSQWVIRSWGMESWALASLPLFAGLMKLDHYFARWDQRKRSASGEGDAKFDAESETADNLRFAMPFRWVGATLAISLFVISLWARFFGTASGSPMWLGVTFTIYSLYFVAIALFRREPRLIYVSGLLAGLVTLFGISAVHGESATSLLAVMAAASAAMVLLGERVGLKLSWKTPLTDCALLGAILVTLLVLWRQFPVEGRGFFPGTNLLDTIALACAAVTYLVTAHQYRSRLPVYGAVIILAMMVPAWSAAVGLAAMVAAGWIERRYEFPEPGPHAGTSSVVRHRSPPRRGHSAIVVRESALAKCHCAGARRSNGFRDLHSTARLYTDGIGRIGDLPAGARHAYNPIPTALAVLDVALCDLFCHPKHRPCDAVSTLAGRPYSPSPFAIDRKSIAARWDDRPGVLGLVCRDAAARG
jgi:hypothetical protein